MSPEKLRQLLESVQAGSVDVGEALGQLRSLPFRDVGIATIDHHRALRQGTPEVVFGEGKSQAQLIAIAAAMVEAGENLLITRLEAEAAAALCERHPTLSYNEVARTARLELSPPAPRPGHVAVVCAGTSDVPVAEEALETLAAVGLSATRIFDVGVAGIHRLLGRSDELERADAAIVIAGMEGALPSVVGGIVACPLIAVPTSVGYGTAMGGLTALFGMLSSCASGIVVVNIDNGFGAAMAAHRMFPRADA